MTSAEGGRMGEARVGRGQAGGVGEPELRRRAIARALARGGARTVTRVRYGLYKVASNSREGRFHTVSADARGTYFCDCEAGVAHRVCWATAAVWLAKLAHTSKVRVVGVGTRARRGPPPATPANVFPLPQRQAGVAA